MKLFFGAYHGLPLLAAKAKRGSPSCLGQLVGKRDRTGYALIISIA